MKFVVGRTFTLYNSRKAANDKGRKLKTTQLDQEKVAQKVREVGRDKAAKYFGVKTSTFRDYLYRNGLPTTKDKTKESKVTIKQDVVEVTSPASTELGDHEKIVRDRGFDPDEWDFIGATVNEWDSPTGEKLQQIKVQIKRKKSGELIMPARTDGPKRKNGKAPTEKAEKTFAVLADQQAPFYDERAHEKVCMFLEDQKPDIVVLNGDGSDFPDVSKYKTHPEIEAHAKVQDCINSEYGIYRDYTNASPDSYFVKEPGNHDIRLRNFVIEQALQLHDLKRAEVDIEEDSVFSLSFLLRLDELGIDYLEPNGPYEHVQYNLSPHLAVRHGWYAVKGSGASALKTLEHLGYSIIVSHTHRQSKVYKTTHDITGEPTVLTAVETGCLCDLKCGHYTVAPDWQVGFATGTVFKDGLFNVDLATYVNGNLLWQGKKY